MFKKVLAVALAATMVCSMATVASAEKVITTSAAGAEISGGNFKYDLAAAGIDYANATGCTVTIKVADESLGFGGGFICNGDECGWAQQEWGNEGSDKAITAQPTGNEGEYTISMSFDKGTFDPAESADGNWAEIFVSSWWGSDFEVTAISVAVDAPATGAVAPIAIVSVVALASAAVVVSRKRA